VRERGSTVRPTLTTEAFGVLAGDVEGHPGVEPGSLKRASWSARTSAASLLRHARADPQLVEIDDAEQQLAAGHRLARRGRTSTTTPSIGAVTW
jgi:hypothetical protein